MLQHHYQHSFLILLSTGQDKIIILTLGILGMLAATGFIFYIVKNAPSFDQELLKEKQSTIIYASNRL